MECFDNVTWGSQSCFEFCELGVATEDLDPLRLNTICLSVLSFSKNPLLSPVLNVLSYKFLEIYIDMLELIH